jgi:outer membrane lipoprotein-sorting protein
MKTSITILLTALLLFPSHLSSSQDASEIIRMADEKMQGEKTSISTMTMTIVRPTWERTISFKNWSKGRDYALTLVTAPAKEQGQAFLKHKNDIWNWNPKISRMIKLPPSMMSQGWMGSDFSNDDLLKESSIVVDYDHRLMGEEKIEGWDCYIIELLPHEDASVVWGKIIKWISRDEYLQMKSEYYDEDGYLIKTELSFDVKKMDDRLIPTRFELVPEEEQGNKTIVTMDDIKFNQPIEDAFFSQQNMKQIR